MLAKITDLKHVPHRHYVYYWHYIYYEIVQKVLIKS